MEHVLGKQIFRIFDFIKSLILSFKIKFFFKITNKTILVSLSQDCPTAKLSIISGSFSTAEYNSAVPNLTPPGFKVASDLP